MREEIMGRHHLFWLRPERAASCYFVDRLFGWQIKNAPRNHTNEHQQGNTQMKNEKWKMNLFPTCEIPIVE
jgi:hypothetical protein